MDYELDIDRTDDEASDVSQEDVALILASLRNTATRAALSAPTRQVRSEDTVSASNSSRESTIGDTIVVVSPNETLSVTDILKLDDLNLLNEALTNEDGAIYPTRMLSHAFEQIPETLDEERDMTTAEEETRGQTIHALMTNRKLQDAIKDQIKTVDKALNYNAKMIQEAEVILHLKAKWSNPHLTHIAQIKCGPRFFTNRRGMPPPFHPDADKHFNNLFIYKWTAWNRTARQSLAKAVRNLNRRHIARNLLKEGKDVTQVIDEMTDKDIEGAVPAPQVAYDIIADQYKRDRSALECAIQWSRNDHPAINHTEWDAEEIDRLEAVAQKLGGRDWEKIAEKIGNGRTSAACFRQYKKTHYIRMPWSKEEDALLREAVETLGEVNWAAIAAVVKGRTSSQSNARWKLISNNGKKGRWDRAEIDKMLKAIEEFGTDDFLRIADRVGTRTAVQCRERWNNVDKPGIMKGTKAHWDLSLDMKLLQAVEKVGEGKWARVASDLGHGFTDSQCKTRYVMLKNTKVSDRTHADMDAAQYLDWEVDELGRPKGISIRELPAEMKEELLLKPSKLSRGVTKGKEAKRRKSSKRKGEQVEQGDEQGVEENASPEEPSSNTNGSARKRPRKRTLKSNANGEKENDQVAVKDRQRKKIRSRPSPDNQAVDVEMTNHIDT